MKTTTNLYCGSSEGGPWPEPASEYWRLLPDFWILEASNAPWQRLSVELDRVLQVSVTPTLILYQPWSPGSDRRRQVFRAAFGLRVENLAGTEMTTTEPGQSTSDVLEVRQRCGGKNSGLWLLAAPWSDVSRLTAVVRNGPTGGSPVFIATEVAEHCLALLALDECEQSALFVRRTHPEAGVLDLLLRGLHAASASP